MSLQVEWRPEDGVAVEGADNSLEASVIVPTYNERQNIVELVEAVAEVLEGCSFDMIVVDDDSSDGTADAVAALATTRPWLSVIRRQAEPSLGGSVMDGLQRAHGRVLCVMDADLSHDPALLSELVARVRGGAELAIGSRRVPGGGAEAWPWHRRCLSDAGNRLARWLLQVPLADTTSGYFAMDRRFYERVRDSVRPRGYKILLEFCVRGRPRTVVELPYLFRDRQHGDSKLTPRVMMDYLCMLGELTWQTWVDAARKGRG
ncbi:MAG: polyprenol monophosphomannose synthase [Candidatus Omnitrophica bacterium]|nr:polyprenol monophosphomannose synthase [Candidatus Omnitrophota bacterium]